MTFQTLCRIIQIYFLFVGWMEDNMPQNTLKLYFDASTVNLEFMPAKVLDVQAPVLTYSVYQMYFSERDFNEEHFLLSLSTKMLQVDNIKANGKLVDTNFVFENNNKSSLTYSAYPGTATVFSVIVTTTYPSVNGSSNEAFSSIYGRHMFTVSQFPVQFDKVQHILELIKFLHEKGKKGKLLFMSFYGHFLDLL